MINKSLTTLGKVIKALTDKKIAHIPYRESKLTRILSESLGGNSKTCLVITCSPAPYNTDETISTLRFGMRARSIKNNAKVNREYTIPELVKLLAKAEADKEIYKMKVNVLEQELTKLGGTVPKDEELEQLALKEKERLEELEEAKEAEEIAKLEAEEVSQALKEQTEAEVPDLEIEEEEEEKTETDSVNLEALQEKNDKIEQLQDELQLEREKLHEALKCCADYKEEIAILEGQVTHYKHEIEKM